jgi:hypothetical protein
MDSARTVFYSFGFWFTLTLVFSFYNELFSMLLWLALFLLICYLKFLFIINTWGRNPVIICVNKSDLLPSGASSERVLKWVYSALKAKQVRNVAAVHLISSVTGKGTLPLGLFLDCYYLLYCINVLLFFILYSFGVVCVICWTLSSVYSYIIQLLIWRNQRTRQRYWTLSPWPRCLRHGTLTFSDFPIFLHFLLICFFLISLYFS